MAWNGKDQTVDTVNERGFTLVVDGREVPGVYWSPTEGTADRLVLLGHGGSGNKKTPYVDLMAHGLCSVGIAAMAIDGPGHGERPGADQWDPNNRDDFAKRWNSDGGTDAILADWKTALDFVEAEHGVKSTGLLGLSMGTMMGLPLCVADDRIKVAVLGLMGVWGPNAEDLARLAPEISIPVRFLVQSDDEVVPAELALELFEALGTEQKTLHTNPGIHSAVPPTEITDAVGYLDAKLAKLG